MCLFFFFKQKTAYEMRISDWSSDVCSSDLTLKDAGNDRRGYPRGHGHTHSHGYRPAPHQKWHPDTNDHRDPSGWTQLFYQSLNLGRLPVSHGPNGHEH